MLPESASERHLTVGQLAEREQVPVQTIYTWNKNGDGPVYLKVGRHVRYRMSDVVAWERTRITSRGRVA
jgi:predicted DNA-binding transcriptional regulator AlpA